MRPRGAILQPSTTPVAVGDSIPKYLSRHYWWAYVHPNAVRVFEREWLVRLILWNQYYKLCDAALETLGPDMSGRTLQVACVYGDLTPRLIGRLAPDARLNVIDVLPVQGINVYDILRRKKLVLTKAAIEALEARFK